MSRASPAAFDCSCAVEPVHAGLALAVASIACLLILRSRVRAVEIVA